MGRRTAPSSVSASAAVVLILLSTAASALVAPAPSRGRPSVGGPAGATIAGSLDGGYARRRWPRLFSSITSEGGVDGLVATTEAPGGASAPPRQTHYDTVVVGEFFSPFSSAAACWTSLNFSLTTAPLLLRIIEWQIISQPTSHV